MRTVHWGAYVILVVALIISSFCSGILVMGLFYDMTVNNWQRISRCMAEY